MAATLDIANARNLAATSFAADPTRPRTVTVIGEVIRPGSYLISPGSTDTSASTSTSGTGAPSITRSTNYNQSTTDSRRNYSTS